jgi:hypothetical protein
VRLEKTYQLTITEAERVELLRALGDAYDDHLHYTPDERKLILTMLDQLYMMDDQPCSYTTFTLDNCD